MIYIIKKEEEDKLLINLAKQKFFRENNKINHCSDGTLIAYCLKKYIEGE